MIRIRIAVVVFLSAVFFTHEAAAQPAQAKGVWARFGAPCESAPNEIAVYGREGAAGNVVHVVGLAVRTNCTQPFQIIFELVRPIGSSIGGNQPAPERSFFGILVQPGALDVFFDRNDLADVGLAGFAVSVGITTDTGTLYPYSAVLDPLTGKLTPIS
ncbi:MAG: hypothetical protein WC815_21540 [Vicinamibacterales bacterium]|jgi:hypothetical protein